MYLCCLQLILMCVQGGHMDPILEVLLKAKNEDADTTEGDGYTMHMVLQDIKQHL